MITLGFRRLPTSVMLRLLASLRARDGQVGGWSEVVAKRGRGTSQRSSPGETPGPVEGIQRSELVRPSSSF
jgi:hypothetical protein